MSDARTQRPFLAGAWMLGALLCLCGMAIAGRELSAELNAFQITFLRSVLCLAAILVLLRVIGFSRVRSSQKKMHVARNAIHFGGQVGWLYGIAVLPLAEVFAIEFTAPIWTAILATVLLGERMNRNRMIAISLGFAGIMIILRPGVAAIQPAALVVLFAAVCFASTFVFTRHMSASESPLTVIFYMNLVQLPMGLIASLPGWTLPSLDLWPWMLLLGASGLGTHFCFAHAFRWADAVVVTPVDFFRLPLIAIVGLLFYGESWDVLILVGGAVIFSGNLINLWSERRSKSRTTRSSPLHR